MLMLIVLTVALTFGFLLSWVIGLIDQREVSMATSVGIFLGAAFLSAVVWILTRQVERDSRAVLAFTTCAISLTLALRLVTGLSTKKSLILGAVFAGLMAGAVAFVVVAFSVPR